MAAIDNNYKMPAALKEMSSTHNPARGKIQSQKNDANNPSTKRDQLMADRDAYLQLLIAQLKNQNPQDPTDTTQMTQQIIAISQAEQTIQTNENLQKLIDLQLHAHRMNSVGLLGKEVEYDESIQSLIGGIKTEFQYSLAENADTIRVKVIDDSTGKTVRTMYLDPEYKKAGDHKFSWDGRNDDNEPMSEDNYRIFIEAKNSNNAPISVATSARSEVIGISEEDGQVKLLLKNGKSLDEQKARLYTQPIPKIAEINTTESETKNEKLQDLSSLFGDGEIFKELQNIGEN